MGNPYESDQLLNDYLLFHYGSEEEQLPWAFGPHEALHYPVRTVQALLDPSRLPANARSLDLGCAVGRSSFELARCCSEVIGIDFSQNFIDAATELQQTGERPYRIHEEGEAFRETIAIVPEDIDRSPVRFEQGDAQALRADIGRFDVVHLANLVDRLPDPEGCLHSLSELLVPGGQLIITSPFTWLEAYTPRERWLQEGAAALERLLQPELKKLREVDLPFLIREHRRKFQWSVAYGSVWEKC